MAHALHKWFSTNLAAFPENPMITRNLSLALFLALGATTVGCAAQAPGTPGDQGGGGDDGSGDGGSGDGGSGTTPTPLSIDGTYKVASTYNLATNMPGTAGKVVNDIIAVTSGANAPSQWIMDQVIAALPSGTIKSAIQDVEPLVIGDINNELLSVAPDFVDTLIQLGGDFGDVAKNFGTVDTIAITGSTATHTVTGAHFVVGADSEDYLFADYNLQNVTVANIGVTQDSSNKIAIEEHKVGLQYGAILTVALNAAIIPALDSNASNLGELLNDMVDCDQIGQYIDDEVGFGGASTYSAACTAGLTYGAKFIYSEITKIDANALTFDITGSARAVDTNNDNKADALKTGAWAGNLDYASAPSTLAPATFSGTRM
jgi:hypothetical protein